MLVAARPGRVRRRARRLLGRFLGLAFLALALSGGTVSSFHTATHVLPPAASAPAASSVATGATQQSAPGDSDEQLAPARPDRAVPADAVVPVSVVPVRDEIPARDAYRSSTGTRAPPGV
jgi:uncharacterized iron-regulated membrane protein